MKNGKVDKYIFDGGYAQASAASTTSENNGKELDKMHGLNTYDYGARQYNPILARWDRIDPLAEKYYDVSLYAYCEDSPVNTFDPDGRNSIKVISKAVYKIGKSVAKNGVESLTKSATYTAAFHGVVEDTKLLWNDRDKIGTATNQRSLT